MGVRGARERADAGWSGWKGGGEHECAWGPRFDGEVASLVIKDECSIGGRRTSLVVDKSDSAPALSIQHVEEAPLSHAGTERSRTTTTAITSTDETMRPPFPITHRHSSGHNDLCVRQPEHSEITGGEFWLPALNNGVNFTQ
jgi:hypothetical protein